MVDITELTPGQIEAVLKANYSAMGKKGGKTAGMMNKNRKGFLKRISREYWAKKKSE